MVDKCLSYIQRLLLPPICQVCDEVISGDSTAELDICSDCLAELAFAVGPCCQRCAMPITSARQVADVPLLCGRCLRDPPAFDNTVTVFAYEGMVARLIQGLKFHGRLSHARLLGGLMGLSLRDRIRDIPDCLLPVPLHRRRLGERGFNQSVELGRHIGRYIGLRQILTNHCVRRRYTVSQADLPARQRRRNVRNAFQCRATIEHRHVTIVDDVMTTGNTVNELARVVKKAGAERVDVWICARASF